jgi:hypothetical protein
MEKNSFARSPKGTLTHLKRLAKTSPIATSAVVGGAANAALNNVYTKANNEKAKTREGKKQGIKKINRTAATIMGGLTGGALGAHVGSAIKDVRSSTREFNRWAHRSKARRKQWSEDFKNDFKNSWGNRYGRGSSSSSNRDAGPSNPKRSASVPEWAKKAKTKDEAKKAYRAEAIKHHPDKGGDPEKMKKVNVEWEDFTKHPNSPFHKMAGVLAAFMDELTSIYSES